MKATLEGSNNGDAYKTFEAMFDEPPKTGTPYWLIRLAIYYGALAIGYARKGMIFSGRDKQMLQCVTRLDENVLRNNVSLWHYMCLHDLEDDSFGGRELVQAIPK